MYLKIHVHPKLTSGRFKVSSWLWNFGNQSVNYNWTEIVGFVSSNFYLQWRSLFQTKESSSWKYKGNPPMPQPPPRKEGPIKAGIMVDHTPLLRPYFLVSEGLLKSGDPKNQRILHILRARSWISRFSSVRWLEILADSQGGKKKNNNNNNTQKKQQQPHPVQSSPSLLLQTQEAPENASKLRAAFGPAQVLYIKDCRFLVLHALAVARDDFTQSSCGDSWGYHMWFCFDVRYRPCHMFSVPIL